MATRATNRFVRGLWLTAVLVGLLAVLVSATLAQDTPAEEAVFYCGSGVSACVNLLAMARAGLPVGRLYVGSWSEWSRLGQPVARC